MSRLYIYSRQKEKFAIGVEIPIISMEIKGGVVKFPA
jgi:hypothetical protein